MADPRLDQLLTDYRWLVDTNGDGLPDEVAVRIVLPDDVTAVVAEAAAELAARLGLESMALTLPIVVRAGDLDMAPSGALLVGVTNRWLTGSSVAGRFSAGERELLPLDGGNFALVGDDERIAAALRRLARDLPDLTGDRGGEVRPAGGESGSAIAPALGLDLSRLYTIDGLLADTDGDFIPDAIRATIEPGSGCDPATLAEAGNIAARLGLESTGLRLPLPGPVLVVVAPTVAGARPTVRIEGGSEFGEASVVVSGEAAARWLARFAPGPDDRDDPLCLAVERIVAALTGDDAPPPDARTVWEESWDLEWEVDEVRRLVRTELLPLIRAGSSVGLDVRVSEAVDIRGRLRDELTELIVAAGGEPAVVVRSAYKPGLSWLTEEVGPVLGTLPTIAELEIRCRECRRRPGDEWFNPRLLKELALIDEAEAARLRSRMATETPSDRWLDPPIRWLMELYPVDELLPVPRERVRFDIDAAQAETYVVNARDQAGTTLWQGSLTVPWTERHYLDAYPDLGSVHPTTGWLSADVDGTTVLDRRVATDLERIWDRFQAEILPRLAAHVRERVEGSEGINEQPFFAALEIDATVSEPDAPLPVREERVSALEVLQEELYFTTLEFLKELGRREAGAAFEAPGQVVPWIHDGRGGPPQVRWTLRDFAGRDALGARPLLPVATARHAVRVVGVEVDGDGLPERIDVRVELPSADARDAALARLATLSGLAVAARIELRGPDASASLELPVVLESLEDDGPAVDGDAVLRRDGVIGYEEHLAVLRRIGRLPGVRLWQAGRSFQGRAAWVVEWALPNGGARASHAKRIAWKPTLLINARHHGNEPSSTISGLQMVEWLASDPAWAERRRRVNLVVVPFENLDGGALAWEMQREHPRWMLHPGRFSALGLEFRTAYGTPEHPGGEARVLPAVWRRWLPDVVADDHGFPSHEWVQLFSGYLPLWPAYWLPRGVAYAYLKYVNDPDFPEHEPVAARLRALMVEETRRDAELVEWNADWADRYVKYANRWLPEAFPFIENDGLLVYFSPGQLNLGGRWDDWGADFSTLYPRVTTVAFVTEIADETAQGAYMDLCARAHEALDVACVRLLTEAGHRLGRRVESDGNDVSLWMGRRRPVVPLEP